MRSLFFVFVVALLFIASTWAEVHGAAAKEAGILGLVSRRIKHIVVLMMENRSFDHLLGYLTLDHDKRIDGLTGTESQPRDINDPSKGFVQVTRGGLDVSPSDPKHGFNDIAIQMNNNQMNGFVYDAIKVAADETNPVSMFDSNSAPIINTLAKEFAVFDSWFCSAPTGTDPNRAFALSGTAAGILSNYNGTQWTQQSYFDYLRENNRSFAGYFQDDVWVFGYFQDMHKPEIAAHIHELDDRFYTDVAAGDLADFVWLQPRMTTRGPDRQPTWQHPDAAISQGEKLIKDVYESLRAGPEWNETLFLITYDEHGGFYDHVAPPNQGVPPPDSNVASNGYTFNSLGIRIPTLAISPWISKGTLVHDANPIDKPTETSQFESTSIMATANKLLGITSPPLSDRVAWASTFTSLVESSRIEPRTDCPLTLPEVDLSKKHDLNQLMEEQRSKPLNEHLEASLVFFCHQHYPELTAIDQCPGRPQLMHNQGLASDWLAVETDKYKRRVGLGKAIKQPNNAENANVKAQA